MPYGLPGVDNMTIEMVGGILRVKDASLDAAKRAAATVQTVNADDFTIQHNGKEGLLLTADSVDRIGSSTTAIAAGVVVGHELTIVLLNNPGSKFVTIKDTGANTRLRGDWKRKAVEAWLKVKWDGSSWVEIGRDDGNATASGAYSHAEGENTFASNNSAHAEGQSTTASGDDAHAEGFNSIASGSASHAGGSSTSAAGHYSRTMGFQSKARLDSMFAQASGNFTAVGDAQFTRTVLRNSTSDTNWKELFINGSNSRWTLEDDHTYACMITIAARMITGGAECAHFTRRLTIERTGGTVTLRSGPAYTYSDHNPGGAYNIQITADDVNKSLKIEVKHDDGVSAKNVRWVGVVEAVEVGY